MTSGRDTLHRIDAAIADARRALSSSSNNAAEDARQLASFSRREMDVYRDLALFRLQHLASDDHNGGKLGRVDSEAEKLATDHDAHLEKLEASRDAAQAEIVNFEADRRQAEENHAAAIEAHETAVARTRERLDADETYQSRASAVEEANAMAKRAGQKLEIAEGDRREKGAAYEADPLFAYLHRRQFGTRDYRAFPLFALLDRWVAGLITYQPNKLNYDRLLEIPERLETHVARLEQLATAAEEALEVYEREALEADGVGKLREKISTYTDELTAIDAKIAAAEERHEALAKDFAAAAAGEAGPLSEAREMIAKTMSGLTVPDLKILAAETETPEDDRLVESLVRIKRERMELEEARRAAARGLDRQARSLSELEDIRRRFKSSRYDSPYSEFSGRDFVGSLIAEFLRGAMSRDDVWRRIERGHRTRRRDWESDFGGDEWRDVFGLPDNWGGTAGPFGGSPSRTRRSSGPRPPRPVSMPRAPRAPRVRFPSGGGSRGGGSRGGGFKTGGGF